MCYTSYNELLSCDSLINKTFYMKLHYAWQLLQLNIYIYIYIYIYLQDNILLHVKSVVAQLIGTT